jgi:long-chain fatty acid transport protein
MKFLSKRVLLSALAIILVSPFAASANNGMFLIGYGAKSRGMGGVGIAYGQDGLAAGANPASMMQVEDSRFDIGGELFFPDRAVSHVGTTIGNFAEESDENIFLIPSMGGISRVSKDFVWGVAVVGAGLGTSYKQTPPTPCPSNYFFNISCGATSPVGVSLMQMQILPSAAFKVSEHNTIGVSIALAAQTFKAYGLQSFGVLGFSSTTEGLTNNGADWSYGLGWRAGWLGQYMDQRLSLGLNYSARVNMSRFTKYEGLFAEQGKFDIPESYGAGLAFKLSDKTDVAFDVMQISYSDVASIGNPGPNAFDSTDFNPLCPGVDPPECKLGGSLGLGFGWTDQTVYKLGFNHKLNDSHTVRVGWNHAKAPIPPDQVLFNMLAPGVVEDTLTLGYTYVTDKHAEITLNYTHGFENTLKGQTMFYPGGSGAPRDGSTNAAIALVIDTIGISYGIKF